MDDTLIILDAANAFYQNAFNQLIAITLGVLGFVGILLPVLFGLYEKRLYRIERETLEVSLKEDLRDEIKKGIESIRAEYAARENE